MHVKLHQPRQRLCIDDRVFFLPVVVTNGDVQYSSRLIDCRDHPIDAERSERRLFLQWVCELRFRVEAEGGVEGELCCWERVTLGYVVRTQSAGR
jgi:hypothetical protein